jgi:hypothetical protein
VSAYKDLIFISGGNEANSDKLSDFLKFNVSTKEWSLLEQNPEAKNTLLRRSHHSMVTVYSGKVKLKDAKVSQSLKPT